MFRKTFLLCLGLLFSHTLPAMTLNNADCLAGKIAITSSRWPLSALPGFLFSTYPASRLPDGPNGPPKGGFPGWSPYLMSAQVTAANGTPIAGCLVDWHALNGYFFSTQAHPKTDANGMVYGYLRGDDGVVSLTAQLVGTEQTDTQSFNVLMGQHNNTVPSPYGGFITPPSSEFMVDIIPLTSPSYTFYEVLSLGGVFYAGLQQLDPANKAFIYSLWGSNNCTAAPQIINDPTHICRPAAMGAEGCVAQCFDPNARWQINGRYQFHLFAAPATYGTESTLGTNYRLVVSDVTANKVLYDITMWAPVQKNIQNPSTFIEQFAGNTDSCFANGLRQALWIQPQYKPVGQETFIPVRYMGVSRPFDVTYGMGSMCFNYNYGGLGALVGFMTATGMPVGSNGNLLVESPITRTNIIIDDAGDPQYSVVQFDGQFYGINENNVATVKSSLLSNISPLIYTDNQCPYLGAKTRLTLNQCADYCMNTKGCTSISVSAGDCVLRGCTTVTAPTTNAPGYVSYTLTPASFATSSVSLSNDQRKQLSKKLLDQAGVSQEVRASLFIK